MLSTYRLVFMTVGVRAVFSILPFRYMLYFNDIICRWYKVFQSLLNCSCMWIPDVWEGFHDRSDLQLFQLVFVSLREKIEIKTNTDTVEPLHNSHLGDRRRWPLWGGRGVILWCLFYCIFFFLRGIQHIYCAKFLLPVAYNGNPIIN